MSKEKLERTPTVQQKAASGPADKEQQGATKSPPAFQLKASAGQGQPMQRKTPDEIRTEYQVKDDTMVDWSPKAFGAIPIPGMDSHKMTKTEGKMLDELAWDKGVMGLSDFKSCKEKAFSVSEAEYPAPSKFPGHAPTEAGERRAWINNDGHRDAFRHAYWNALLTKNFGKEWAKQFATAHEGVPGNPAEREAMDLYNNEVGRNIAAENKGKSDAELATLIKAAVSSGKLLVIDKNSKLVWSNTVALWEHGTTTDTPIDGKIATPKGDASANDTGS